MEYPLEPYWLIKDVIAIKSLPMPLLQGWRLSFQQNETVTNSGITTIICAD